LEILQVIALDVNLPVKQAFHILYEQVYFICQLPLCQLLFLLGCSSLCLSPSYKHSNIVASRPGKGRKWNLSEQHSSNYTSRLFGFLVFANSRCFQGIPLAPLWDFGKGQFVGVLGPLDFILILREVGFY